MIGSWFFGPNAISSQSKVDAYLYAHDLAQDSSHFDVYEVMPHESVNTPSDVMPPEYSTKYSKLEELKALPSLGPNSVHGISVRWFAYNCEGFFWRVTKLTVPPMKLTSRIIAWIASKTATVLVERPETVVVAAATAYLLFALNKRRIQQRLREGVSYILAKTRICRTSPRVYKSAFSKLIIPECKPIQDVHSHPYSAAARNNVSKVAHAYALSVGLTPYYVQMSATDQARGYQGSRNYYWYKDLSLDPVPYEPNPSHLQIILDTDHYMDMPYFLSWQQNPILVATIQPHAVAMDAHKDSNFSFTFNKDNEIDYIVSGSARYQHHVWNYNRETLTAYRTFCGIPYCSTSYLVERITSEPHHELILLIPIGSWKIISSIMNWLFGENNLARLVVNHGTHNRLLVKTTNELLMSTGLPGSFSCATIPVALDDTIAVKASLSKTGLTNAGIASMLPGDPSDPEVQKRNTVSAAILNHYHTHNPIRTTPNLVAPNPKTYHRYQYNVQDDDAKPTLYAYMQPIVHGAYGPDKTPSNEQQAVNKRIKAPSNDTSPTPFILKCIDEFINVLVPIPHQYHPQDFEQLPEHFNKPVQKLQYNNVNDSGFGFIRRIKSFIKAEAYSKPAAPRIISTLNDFDKMHYSQYQYSVSEFLKTVDCYAFGKTPVEVADKIVQMASTAQYLTEGDFSTFDGSIGESLRLLERSFILRLFNPKYHEWIIYLLDNQINLLARLPLGTTYKQQDSRASGSPETSNFNTLDNMFVNYLARRLNTDSLPSTIHAKFTEVLQLSIFGGDDSLAADLPAIKLQRACKMLGLIVKVKTIQRNQGGATFLSRVFTPDVWNGDPNNCADILRQMRKLHVSHIRPQSVTDQQYLVDKMAGYLYSDSNTPYLGELAKKTDMLAKNRNLKPDPSNLSYLAKWASESGTAFPNEYRDYFLEYAHQTMPKFKEDIFHQHLDNCTDLDQLLIFPLCMEEEPPEIPLNNGKPEATIHVDGETISVARPKSKVRERRSRDRARTFRSRTRTSGSPSGGGSPA